MTRTMRPDFTAASRASATTKPTMRATSVEGIAKSSDLPRDGR